MRCPAHGSQVLMELARVFGGKEGIAEPNLFLVPARAA
jgi:hypothetical protein